MSEPASSRGFFGWVAATFGTELGAGAMTFALTWTATAHGPHLASAVLTLSIVPAVVLGLLGGAIADRFGPRHVLVGCTAAMALVSAGLMVSVMLLGTPPALLLFASVLVGTVAAFQRPAAGVFPRLFVAGDKLGAAMAQVGTVSQFARTIAPPIGGLLVGALTLAGVAALDLIGGVVMLAVLLAIRPPRQVHTAPESVSLRGIAAGLAAARATGGVPALLLCVGIVAGAVIPAVLLGVPLAARERGWSASQAGLVEAGWIAGGLVLGAWYAWRGTSPRVWVPMAIGPIVITAGLLILALSPVWGVAALGTTLLGAGVVVFTAHVFPTYVQLAPPEMVSRFQSLLILVQQAPQLVINTLIGLLVAISGAATMIAASSLLAAVAAIVVTSNRTLRGFRTATTPQAPAGAASRAAGQ